MNRPPSAAASCTAAKQELCDGLGHATMPEFMHVLQGAVLTLRIPA